MPKQYPSREKLIDLLIDDDINGFYDRDDQAAYLSYILRSGFAGYENQTYEQLIDECIDRQFFEEEENAEI